MDSNSRRRFLKNTTIALAGGMVFNACSTYKIMTVNGWISARRMGNTLTHEHLLVDFIGAKEISSSRWNRKDVIRKVLPYLLKIKQLGCRTFVDCTPNYLGRDPILLQMLSQKSGLHILTNTGYYGAREYHFLPPHAVTETAEQLAARWIGEFENGIDTTDIRPGFIKIGVNGKSLTEIEKKLVTAAAFTHLKTGLTIAAHTGPAVAALEEITLLRSLGVHPSAFIWVHAQNEKDRTKYLEAAKQGAWISLDGLNSTNQEQYLTKIQYLKQQGFLKQLLISHDAGWYRPGEENGGDFRGFSTLFEAFIPFLLKNGFTEKDINTLIVENPANAFEVGIKKLPQKHP